jgi:heme oxygenase
MAPLAKTQGSSILDGLRQQTKAVHEQLHHHAHFVSLFQGSIGRQNYCDLLSRFHGFYAPLENAIEQAEAGDTGGYSYAKRAHLLALDLHTLGLDPVQIQSDPKCATISDIVTPASLGGVLYVIEGSTLGAAQIDRAAQKLFSTVSLEGRQFWAWSRAQNKIRWSSTLGYLQHLEDQGASHDDIICGARDTFQALADWLAPLDSPTSPVESPQS